jgi:hypothetical protein
VDFRLVASATDIVNAYFYSDDGRLLQGTINGRRLMPFPTRADANTVKFSDGQPAPTIHVDPDLPKAIEYITRKANEQQSTLLYSVNVPAAAIVHRDNKFKSDGGHGSHPSTSGKCIGCEASCASAGVGCALGVAGGCAGESDFLRNLRGNRRDLVCPGGSWMYRLVPCYRGAMLSRGMRRGCLLRQRRDLPRR